MKKILLSVLLGGFILNNGYCFDEWFKITNEYLDRSFWNLRDVDVNYLNDRLKEFGKEVLLSKIPSGKYAGKQVKDLLIARKFNGRILQTICDDSVRFAIIDYIDAMSVIFELLNGEKIEINAAPSLTEDLDNDETKGFRAFLYHQTFGRVICTTETEIEIEI